MPKISLPLSFLLRLLTHSDFWVCLGASGVEEGPEKGRAWPSRISDVIEGTRCCPQLVLAAYWTERGIGQWRREGRGGRKGEEGIEKQEMRERNMGFSGWKVEAVSATRAVVENELVPDWSMSPELYVSRISQKYSLLWLFFHGTSTVTFVCHVPVSEDAQEETEKMSGEKVWWRIRWIFSSQDAWKLGRAPFLDLQIFINLIPWLHCHGIFLFLGGKSNEKWFAIFPLGCRIA